MVMLHPLLGTGRVAIYARYSSERQNEASIDDQVRRVRDAIQRTGGDPDKAKVFADYAISGRSMDRRDFEALMLAVEERRFDVVVVDDISRVSRDWADSAHIFRRLQFLGVPLIGLADGIDTSAKNAKLHFGLKSLIADDYIDKLRSDTLRGLEGRALDGYATGAVPFGYRTVAKELSRDRTVRAIEIDEAAAPIVRRIFTEYLDGGALHRIAQALNREGIASPRAGTKHKRYGWGAPTIRAILYNEKYSGTWRYKERQWVKIPGTNKREPRNRPAEDVISVERPDLRIIDAELWTAVQDRLKAIHRKYAGEGDRIASPRRQSYLLSGILVCEDCGFPLSVYGGRSRFYRCSTAHTKGLCENNLKVREDVLRATILDGLREQLQRPTEIAYVRKAVAERVRDYARNLEAELKDRRERLKRTEDRIRGLVQFISDGDRSEYVTLALRDLEAQAKADRAGIERVQREAQRPLPLPSVDEITRAVFNVNRWLADRPDVARPRLRRWLKDGVIRIGKTPDAAFKASGTYYPLAVASETKTPPQSQGVETAESNVSSGGRI
jgi:site-specific DNA recombinase